MSFKDVELEPPISVLSIKDIKSISLHSNCPAKPFTHSILSLIETIWLAVEKLLFKVLLLLLLL